MAPLPLGLFSAPIVFYNNSLLLICGGDYGLMYGGIGTKEFKNQQCFAYDPALNSWDLYTTMKLGNHGRLVEEINSSSILYFSENGTLRECFSGILFDWAFIFVNANAAELNKLWGLGCCPTAY